MSLRRVGGSSALRGCAVSSSGLTSSSSSAALVAAPACAAVRLFGSDFFKNVGSALRKTGDSMQQQWEQSKQQMQQGQQGGGCPGGSCGNNPFANMGGGGNQQQQNWGGGGGGTNPFADQQQWPGGGQQQQQQQQQQQGGGNWSGTSWPQATNQAEQYQPPPNNMFAGGSTWRSGGGFNDITQFIQMQKTGFGNDGRGRDPFGNGDGGGGGPGNGGGGGGGGGGPGGFMGGMFDQMLEWCSKAHAQDIARRMGIDLHDIRFTFDQQGNCTVHVDAPNATPEQIAALGERVQEECPVARFRKTQMAGGGNTPKRMEWVPLPPSSK